MRQAVMISPGVIRFLEPEIPQDLKPTEVRIQIKRIGVCGSDIHVYHGEHPSTPYPVVQGHEYSAIVEKTGSDVIDILPGMKVTARPQLVCGTCIPCQHGLYNICQNLRVQGFQAPGVAQDYFVIDASQIVRLPDSMSFDEGALVEPSAVGAHATNRATDLKGKNVVVCGAGTIGNLVAQFALIRGAKKVVITDLNPFRLEKAKACGISETINLKEESFEDGIKRAFGDEGFQAGFEAVGAQPALDALMKNIQKGSEIVILGVYGTNPQVNMFHLGEHELKLIGSLMYREEDYQEAVELIASGKLNVKELITHRFPFEQYAEAYHFTEQGDNNFLKIMIDL